MTELPDNKVRIRELLGFLGEIEDLKKIERCNYYPDLDRAENDAEHSWHLAMFLILFEPDLPKSLDKLRMLKMALIHDLVEIHAGDTFVYDEKRRKSQEARENLALGKLLSGLPEDLRSEFEELFLELRQGHTKEAEIVNAFDRIQAIHQNLYSGWLTYRRHKISLSAILREHKAAIHSGEPMTSIYEIIFDEARKKGYI